MKHLKMLQREHDRRDIHARLFTVSTSLYEDITPVLAFKSFTHRKIYQYYKSAIGSNLFYLLY